MMTKEEAIKKLHKGIRDAQINKRVQKTYKDEYYSVNSIFGNDWARFYYLLGGREAGKSYSAMKWAVTRKLRNPDKVKFYWFRLTEASQKKLLLGGAKDFIDPDLRRKFNIKCCTNGNTIYTYQEKTVISPKTGRESKQRVNKQEFCRVMACSTFYNDKGVGYFDNQYDGEYICVLDEMNREQSEKNTFDIVYNFSNQLENVLRSVKNKVKVILIGNTLEEASDLLSNLNFIPDDFGRYKLKRKKAVVDYIKPNEKYLERRKEATANLLAGNASTFTNEISVDRSLLVSKRKRVRPEIVIKFTRTKDTWFTLWNDNIIHPYNNEQVQAIAMRRYLDEIYDSTLSASIIERFDARAFKFTTLATYKQFQKQMRLLKPAK